MFWDVLSTFMNVVGNLAEGRSQVKAAAYNQRIASFNAQTYRESGKIEEDRVRREARKRVGLIRANVGASGFSMEGSALDVLSESVFSGEFDAQLTKYNYGRQAQGAELEAQLYGAQGSDARRAGYLNAASSLLKGGATIYGRDQNYGSSPFKLGG